VKGVRKVTDEYSPVIEVKELWHCYLSGTPLETVSLRGVDLEVREGETVGIIGPSGSGKSTLLYHLNGLMRPQQGDVRVFGKSLKDPAADAGEVKRRVGFLFQNPENQLFERYAGDDVAFGPRNLGLTPSEVRQRVRSSLDMVGFPFLFKDRLVSGLSTGEKRRIAIAGVLAMDPEALVLDEPTASLDPSAKKDLFSIIENWKKTPGRAVVMVSHSMEDIAELSDRIYVLARGKVVLYGTARKVFSHPDILTRHGLTLPIPALVIERLKAEGLPVRSGAFTVEEAVREIEEVIGA
jgi:energy-coupling factor transporter ATPase